MLLIANSQDPRARRTRRDLEQSLLHLLKQRSLNEITVRDITEQAGINRATFYAHFVDKYALFDHLVSTLFQQALDLHIPEGAALTRANLLRLTLGVFDFVAPLHSTQCTTSGHQEVRPLFESQIQKQLRRRMMQWMSPFSAPQEVVEVSAAIVSWSLFGAGLQVTNNTQQELRERAAHVVVDFTAAGLEHTLGIRLL